MVVWGGPRRFSTRSRAGWTWRSARPGARRRLAWEARSSCCTRTWSSPTSRC
ncbi:hypothetical protein T492DRAFT_1025460 [Pavlovales sp. CCMP2436]|nr:hypothetical protein T492DRAFT_1025460 [Pavlovales sp. CCMP2436]